MNQTLTVPDLLEPLPVVSQSAQLNHVETKQTQLKAGIERAMSYIVTPSHTIKFSQLIHMVRAKYLSLSI
jgi:hypothetical protein